MRENFVEKTPKFGAKDTTLGGRSVCVSFPDFQSFSSFSKTREKRHIKVYRNYFLCNAKLVLGTAPIEIMLEKNCTQVPLTDKLHTIPLDLWRLALATKEEYAQLFFVSCTL